MLTSSIKMMSCTAFSGMVSLFNRLRCSVMLLALLVFLLSSFGFLHRILTALLLLMVQLVIMVSGLTAIILIVFRCLLRSILFLVCKILLMSMVKMFLLNSVVLVFRLFKKLFFMIQDFKPYDVRPRTDLNIVPQFGWLDLRVSYATGVIQGDIESVEGNFNGIDDPRGILGKPDDVFAALRASASVESVAAPAASHPSVAPEVNIEGA